MAKQPKRPRGIGLRPELWERIEYWAGAKDKTVNEYVEAVLDLNVPAHPDFRKSHVDSQITEDENRPVEFAK